MSGIIKRKIDCKGGIDMGVFNNMAELLEDKQIGNWKLEKFTVDRNNLAAMIQGITPGTYVKYYLTKGRL